jgi:small subunit ribosomal protein S1
MTPPPDEDVDEDFGSALAQFEQETGTAPKKGAKRKSRQVGDMVRARVVNVGHDAVFVDLGDKAEGVLDLVELRGPDGKATIAVGDEVEARIVEIGKDGIVVLRKSGMGRGPAAKAELEQAYAAGIPVEGTVTGVNKGGVEVQVAGVRGFCPISQLDLRHVEDPAPFVGRKLSFRITKYDVAGRNADLVVSRRALLQEEEARRAEGTREHLAVGAVMRGTVTTLKDYGAFVDLGGLEGMIHVSELGFARVGKPSDVLTVGQPVEVVVLKISTDEKGNERIGLSLKALEKDPWADAAERFGAGARAIGTVMRIEQFGAFVELAPGIEGLLHVSELAQGKQSRHAREHTKVGDKLEVIVQVFEAERRRISLALSAKVDAETIDAEGAARAQAPAKMGTLADLIRKSLESKQKKR